MEFTEAKLKLESLRVDLRKVEIEYEEVYRIYKENERKMRLYDNTLRSLSKEIKKMEQIIESEDVFESVKNVEGFDTLTKNDLFIISKGMDKRDYRDLKIVQNCPRWIDLERLVKEVIHFKSIYPGWILENIIITGHYDSLPPQTFYKFTYKTPTGHYMMYSGMDTNN
jgi:type I site-specific restriction-modification system R (restriction) subunit